MIRIMVVDDQPMIRAGLRTILEAHPLLTIVAEAGDGLTALHLLGGDGDSDSRSPYGGVDVVLMDIRMPGLDGVETTRRIRAAHGPGLPVLVLTTFDEDENVLAALRAGADGFFSKGAGPEELAEGILRVAGGGRALSPSAVDAVVQHVADRRPAPPDDPVAARLFETLTPREREVVESIVDGLGNDEIGARMFVSPFTVKTHASRAMLKVGARDRAHLVSLAVRAGIRP